MAEREKATFYPNDDDAALIDESISFHGGAAPDAIRRGLRAGHREIEVLKEIHTEAKKAAAKGNASRPRKR